MRYILQKKHRNYVNKQTNEVKNNFFLYLMELYFEDHRWFHANPTIYNSNKFKSLYKNYIYGDTLNPLVEKLNHNLLNENKKLIIVKGKRGSGKTTFLNYYINTQTRKLNEFYNKTWIRIDTTKIYRNNLDIHNKKFDLNFEKYLYGQLLFVISRYGIENTNLIINDERIKLDNYDSVLKKISTEFEKILSSEEKETYDNIRKKCQNADNFTNDISSKPFDEISFELGKKLWEIADKHMIIFIDGIDNIDYNSFLIKNTYNDLLSFIKKFSSTPKIIALRDEVSLYLKNNLYDKGTKRYIHINDIEEIEISQSKLTIDTFIKSIFFKNIKGKNFKKDEEENSYNKFLEKLLTILPEREDFDVGPIDKDNKTYYLERYLLNNLYTYNYDQFNRLKAKGYNFVDELAKAINYLADKDRHPFFYTLYSLFSDVYLKKYTSNIVTYFNLKTPDEICYVVFNNDFREMILNFFKSFLYCVYNYNAKYKTKYIHFMDFFNTETFDKILTSGILKNGNLYCVGYRSIIEVPPFRNINFINLLNLQNIDLKDGNFTSLPPLITVSILKYLTKKGEASLNDIIELWKGSEKERIEEIIFTLFEFGYLDFVEDKINSDFTSLPFKLTEKGKLVLDRVFKDIDWIHIHVYNSLSLEDITPYFKRFKNDFSDYVKISLYNSIIFLYNLYIQVEDINAKTNDEKLHLNFQEHILTDKLKIDIKSYASKIKIQNIFSLFIDISDDDFKNKLKQFLIKSHLSLQTIKFTIGNLYNIRSFIDIRELSAFLLYHMDYSIDDILNKTILSELVFGSSINRYKEPKNYEKYKSFLEDIISEYNEQNIIHVVEKIERLKLEHQLHEHQL